MQDENGTSRNLKVPKEPTRTEDQDFIKHLEGQLVYITATDRGFKTRLIKVGQSELLLESRNGQRWVIKRRRVDEIRPLPSELQVR